jgi:hypothetical protein
MLKSIGLVHLAQYIYLFRPDFLLLMSRIPFHFSSYPVVYELLIKGESGLS